MREVKNLPSGWKVVRLGDVCEINPSSRKLPEKFYYIDLESVEKGILHSLKEVFLETAPSRAQRLLEKGDILFQMVRPYQKNNFLFELNGNFVASTGYAQIRTKQNRDFIFQYLNFDTFTKKVIEKCTGSNYPAINASVFSNLMVLLPPVDEQEKIAEILSTWDEAINLTINLIESKKQFKKALMQNLLTAKIRFPEFKGEWREIRLGNIGKSYNGLIGKVAEDFQNGKSNFITYKNIFDNPKIDINIFEKVKIMEDEEQNLVKFGDIFFTTSSETPNEVWISSVLLSKCGILYLNSFCFGFRLNNFEILSPCFAVFYFRSDCFRKQIFKLAQGSTRFNISKTEVLNLNIKIPNLDEQQKIAEVLTACDDEINLLNLKLENLKKQKQGLMQKLLSGKVRI